MKPRQAVLERRRQMLHARIAAQRSQLAEEMQALRGPLHVFEVARSIGERVRRYAPVIAGITVASAFVLTRGGALNRAMRTIRLAQRSTSVLEVAKLALRLLQHRLLTSA